MKIRKKGELQATPIDMTPMIDVVFQLLIFFMLTFKVIAMEGDFSMSMPLSAPSAGPPPEDLALPINVKLRADSNGNLAGIVANDRNFGINFRDLHNYIRQTIGDGGGPGAAAEQEVEFDCDYGLHYRHVVEALTAVSGYVDDQGNVVKLIEKIKFTPPKAPPPGV